MADGKRILYVDDEPGLLEIGKIFLERNGAFVVDTFSSAEKALDHLESEHYDAIVSDFQMPDMDGITFLKALRARGNTTPFIIFTGRGREEVVIEALNSGADFYLQKGGDPKPQFAELVHKIHHAIANKQASRAIEKRERDYHHLIENANEAIFVIQDNQVRMINPQTIELSGYSEQELLNQPFQRFVHPDDADILVDRYRKRIAGSNDPNHYSFRIIRKDETIRWVELHVVGITWDEHPAILNFMTDITERKIAEDSLRESEERYRQFFRTTQDSLFITTPDGHWIDFNDAVIETFGFDSREEILGVPVFSIYAHPEERDAFLEFVTREGYLKDYPLQFRKRDGTVFDSLITIVSLKNPDGSTKAFIGAVRDITDRKRAEDALLESEVRYRRIFESFDDLYYQTDINGIITILSPSLYRLTGYTAEELIGKPVTNIYVNPESRRELLDAITKEGRVRDFEVLMLKRDGSKIMASLNANLIYKPDGTPAGVDGILRDITWRKLAEDELRESEEKHRILLDKSVDPIFSFYPDGTYRYVNRAFADGVGKSVDQITGKRIWDIFPQEEAEKRFSVLSSVFSTGEGKQFEVRVPRPDSDHYYVTTVVPIKDANGAVISAICSSKEITDRKQAEQALREANKKLNLLTGITRHDIRNQITILQGYLGLLENKQESPPYDEYIRKCNAAAQRISSMIEFTKEYEKIGATAPSWQDIRILVNSTVPLVALGNILIKNNIPDGTELFADPLIAKVIYNLMDNAMRYGGKITEIRFFVEKRGENLIVVCEDDGYGMQADEKTKIFLRGFGKNTGLGLALSQEILLITGITIIENGEPGKGARFEMVMPKGAFRFAGNT
jgi:PAS domain S-box-containing protein